MDDHDRKVFEAWGLSVLAISLWALVIVLLCGGCTTAMESSCERTTVGNYCYWSGGMPNGAGNGPSSAATGASHGKSATSGGMAR